MIASLPAPAKGNMPRCAGLLAALFWVFLTVSLGAAGQARAQCTFSNTYTATGTNFTLTASGCDTQVNGAEYGGIFDPASSVAELVALCERVRPDLVVVGPEAPLADGLAGERARGAPRARARARKSFDAPRGVRFSPATPP